jgi:hypothetical protein
LNPRRKRTKKLLSALTQTFPDESASAPIKLFASFSRKRRPSLAFYRSASRAVGISRNYQSRPVDAANRRKQAVFFAKKEPENFRL